LNPPWFFDGGERASRVPSSAEPTPQPKNQPCCPPPHAEGLVYFSALKNGPASGVAALDRLSVVFVLALALVLCARDPLTFLAGWELITLLSSAVILVSRAADHGIPKEDIVVDPLVMPIGAIGSAGRQVFRIVRRLREELGVNTTCGASNVSFGLPNRPALNAAFLPMAIASGLTSAITSPLHAEMLQAVKAADVMMGNDAHCASWIARNGASPAGEATRGRRGGREGRRRAASS